MQIRKQHARIRQFEAAQTHVLRMRPSRVFFGPLFGTCFALGAALQRVFSGAVWFTVNYFFLQSSNNYFWN